MNMLKTMKLSPEAKRKLTVVDQDPKAKKQLEDLVRKTFLEKQQSIEPSEYTTPTAAIKQQSKMYQTAHSNWDRHS